MTLVVGVAPDGRGAAALELAAMLARSTGEDVVLGAVVPSPWLPGPARVDAEYQAELARTAQAALEEAQRHLPDASTQVVHARSVPAGLLELAEAHDAVALVLGPSSSLGSASDRLLHSSPVPLALAPRGFRCGGECPVRRVSAAYGGGDDGLIAIAAREAERVGATLRVVSFAVHPRAPITAGVGQEADRAIAAQWDEAIRATIPDSVVGHGATWEEALADVEWEDGDVLVVGSSSIGPVARVFLGSRAAKIVRHAPVPVVVVPRASAS
jgi:nucleotide-binding universal stress UspA family protein